MPNGRCEDAYAYVADIRGYQMAIYTFKGDRSWVIQHSYFHFDPLLVDFNVDGINYQDSDGIFGIALGKPTNSAGERIVYFHPFASSKEFKVLNTVLKNEAYVTTKKAFHEFKVNDKKKIFFKKLKVIRLIF